MRDTTPKRPRLQITLIAQRSTEPERDVQVVLHGIYGPLYDCHLSAELDAPTDKPDLTHIREEYGVPQSRIRKVVRAHVDAGRQPVELRHGSKTVEHLGPAPEDEFPIHHPNGNGQ